MSEALLAVDKHHGNEEFMAYLSARLLKQVLGAQALHRRAAV